MHTLTHTRERERECCIPTYTHTHMHSCNWTLSCNLTCTHNNTLMNAYEHTQSDSCTFPPSLLVHLLIHVSFTFQSDARNSRGSMLLFILALSSEIGSHFLMLCSNCWVSNLGRKPTSSPSISKCNRPSCVKISIYQSDWAYMCLCTWVCLCVQVKLYACVFGWVGLGASLEWFGSECTVPPSPPKVICCTGM